MGRVLRAVVWIAAAAPWIVCAVFCAGILHVPPRAMPARPVLREDVAPRPPDPPKPKGVRYEPWEEVPS